MCARAAEASERRGRYRLDGAAGQCGTLAARQASGAAGAELSPRIVGEMIDAVRGWGRALVVERRAVTTSLSVQQPVPAQSLRQKHRPMGAQHAPIRTHAINRGAAQSRQLRSVEARASAGRDNRDVPAGG